MATPQQSKKLARGRSAAVSPVAIDQVSSVLENLPEKRKDFWTLKDAIAFLQGAIEGAIDKGYSLDDIAEILTDANVPINTPSLRYYLTRLKRQADPATERSRQPRKEKATERAQEQAIEPRSALSISKRLGTSKNRRVAEVISFLLDESEISPESITQAAASSQRRQRKRGIGD